jgi:hypothetical protein
MNHAVAVLEGSTWHAGRSRVRARLRPWREQEPEAELPTLVILLPLEGRPQLRLRGCGQGDADRVAAWIRGRERLIGIVAEAMDLHDEGLSGV